jgi:hypothetical protein
MVAAASCPTLARAQGWGSLVRLWGEFRAGQSLAAALSCFRVVYCELDIQRAHSLLHNGSAANVPTLNFAQNAKFRMAHSALLTGVWRDPS